MSRNITPERPTLPSIHSLGLLSPDGHPIYEQYVCPTPLHPSPYFILITNLQPRQSHHSRRVSGSSSTTSRTSSPTPCDTRSRRHSRAYTPYPAPTARPTLYFLPCAIEEADAAIIVPSPTAPYIPDVFDLGSPKEQNERKRPKNLFIVGPPLHTLRQPGCHLPEGVSVYPYRVATKDRSRPSLGSLTKAP